jgi:hypothetical protein
MIFICNFCTEVTEGHEDMCTCLYCGGGDLSFLLIDYDSLDPIGDAVDEHLRWIAEGR